ncbi:uncharacterized protein LOC111335073 [Stylophora pistillata]|uniref:uncharacterized protein LOC111335073 n=1 Tax=Stylophora pistillata TaxID=50429 RepID=UPI000C03B1BE|nr:uncharacterized protein LOC111335073 [Stylophora pistillata]
MKNEIEAHSIRLRPLAWQELVCMRFEVFGCPVEGAPENCIDPLGLESGHIPDEALSHSVDTSRTVSNPTYIRLNKDVPYFPFGWQATMGGLDYLQVDFGSLRKVTRVATQGAASFFVTRFQLKFSNNSIEWLDYTENGIIKELNGPKDDQEAKNPILVKLFEPFTARYVRFIPTSAPVLKIMRAELYGCMAEPLPPFGGVPEYSRRAVLLDPDSGRFYVCMYTEQKSESSCFSSIDGLDWTGLDESIVSIIAFDPANGALFGVDYKMSFHRSTDDGVTWKTVSSKYFYDLKNETALIMSTGIPENLVSASPSSFWSATSSSGKKWAVSASGVHSMAAGQTEWSMVALWKCCGN